MTTEEAVTRQMDILDQINTWGEKFTPELQAEMEELERIIEVGGNDEGKMICVQKSSFLGKCKAFLADLLTPIPQQAPS